MILSPSDAITLYHSLAKAIGTELLKYTHFADKELNFPVVDFEFDPTEFSRKDLVMLARANSLLQYNLELLTCVIEYVPYICEIKGIKNI